MCVCVRVFMCWWSAKYLTRLAVCYPYFARSDASYSCWLFVVCFILQLCYFAHILRTIPLLLLLLFKQVNKKLFAFNRSFVGLLRLIVRKKEESVRENVVFTCANFWRVWDVRCTLRCVTLVAVWSAVVVQILFFSLFSFSLSIFLVVPAIAFVCVCVCVCVRFIFIFISTRSFASYVVLLLLLLLILLFFFLLSVIYM